MGSADPKVNEEGRAARSTTADVTVGIPTRNRSGLLRQAVESILAQTYSDFTLLISDNASDDDTADVVASLGDPRIVYRPLEQNIGRTANTNRLIELAETEFVVLLGDDDKLDPEHLRLTVEALKARPSVGVIHTGYAVVDEHGQTLSAYEPRSTGASDPVVVQTGREFVEQCMRQGTNVCFSSVVFRKAAFIHGGGLRLEDGVVDDFPLFMRIATAWDVAFIDEPLALMRTHEDASSSTLGSFTPQGFRQSRSVPEIMFEHRLKFLANSDLPDAERRRLTAVAEATHRREILSQLSMRAATGDGAIAALGALRTEIRRDLRLAVDPQTWRFIVGQLGGRRARDTLQRVKRSAPRRR